MAGPPPLPPKLTDAAGCVIADVPCRRCSYNLRGLNAEGVCPECSAAVALSLHGDLLRYADPQWVSQLRRGCRLILWGLAAAMLAGIVVGALVSSMGKKTLGELLSPLAIIVSIYGVWLLTGPDPSGVNERAGVTARKVVRAALLAGFVGVVLPIVSAVMSLSPPARIILKIGVGVENLIILTGAIALLLHIERLANRAPDPDLAKLSRTTRWGLGLTMFSALVMQTCSDIWSLAGRPIQLIDFLFVPVALAYCLFLIEYLIVLATLNGTLRAQAKLAQQTWTAQQA